MKNQDFHIQLTSKHPNQFKIVSPNEIIFYASWSETDGIFNQFNEKNGIVNAVVRSADEEMKQINDGSKSASASIDIWHH